MLLLEAKHEWTASTRHPNMCWYVGRLTQTPENFSNLDFPSKLTRRILLTWHAVLSTYSQNNVCLACGHLAWVCRISFHICSWRSWTAFSAMPFWKWMFMPQIEIDWFFAKMSSKNELSANWLLLQWWWCTVWPQRLQFALEEAFLS